MTLGLIGLGNLGLAIAENLLLSTKQLYVFNRTASKSQMLIAKGAILCPSVQELASRCDIVFSVVADDNALLSITEGDSGIAAHLKQGGIHISVSTILPATSIRLSALHQQHQNHYIASPVMGRPETARAGKLNFLISGEKTILDTISPILLQAGGARVWEFGEKPDAANVAKLCSNFLIASAIQSMSEGIQLATQSGLSAHAWMYMMTETLFSSPIYKMYSNIILDGNFEPAAFSLKLGLKDINLVLAQARAVQSKMPVATVLQQQLNKGVEQGLAEHDWTALALTIK